MNPSSSPAFHKSTYSANASDCVEVAELPGVAAVRDTKHRELGALFFGAGEWQSFLDSTKADLR